MIALARPDNVLDFPAQRKEKSNEWFTPSVYIEAAREVMGGIDLDPASCELANRTVKATRYYTERENGLQHPWMGRIWLNPPYIRTSEMRARHQSTIKLFTDKLIEEYLSGNVSEAFMLTTTEMNAKWFQPLWEYPICFTDHKISFITLEKRKSYTHMFGTAFTYLGPNEQKFIDVFQRFGTIAKRVSPPRHQVRQASLWECPS